MSRKGLGISFETQKRLDGCIDLFGINNPSLNKLSSLGLLAKIDYRWEIAHSSGSLISHVSFVESLRPSLLCLHVLVHSLVAASFIFFPSLNQPRLNYNGQLSAAKLIIEDGFNAISNGIPIFHLLDM
ncbi:unnamed protein product [Thlaspi arvense]|uniref:Uncharacterized protein n=1 Tax=Thlaspi arvense TaxID=13288 RepID=A0AAU9RTZ3_THLAR|nr:unnamed protein product [Thlaspi arvense]